jgi:hypothetical protein
MKHAKFYRVSDRVDLQTGVHFACHGDIAETASALNLALFAFE